MPAGRRSYASFKEFRSPGASGAVTEDDIRRRRPAVPSPHEIGLP